MRGRLLHIALGFVAAFVLLAIADARVQLVDRSAIEAHPGDPRHAESIAARGTLFDARGVPLAQSKGDRRVYPAGPALAQIIGYASPIYGDSGLEAGLDSIISARGETAPTIFGPLFGPLVVRRSSTGADVVLTIRSDIADIVDRALPPDIRGAAIVMDPRTGSILAAVNRPTFDPNRLEKDWKSLRQRADAPLLDRAVAGLYPPGSTFKIVTVSAALDAGAVTPEDTFTDPGYFEVNGYKIHDNENEATGTQSVTGAFALSSNVDFAQIGVKVGMDDFYAYMARFGVGEPTDLAVSVERDEVPPQNSISQSELAQMAFGQGSLAVTPLRMALAAGTIANGGITMRPQLVKQIHFPGKPLLSIPPATGAQAISAETANEVRSMMEAVVRYGTGTAAALRGVAVAGKTGTATHPGAPPDAWFVCFAPADEPRLVVAVVVEDAGYGGVVAAPIARTILAGALPLYPR
jgi:peptidoglycan glycosyltransferase